MRIQVQDCWEGESEEEIICCAAGEFSRLEVGKFEEIRLREEEGIEPIHATFVAGIWLAADQTDVNNASMHTLSVDSPTLIFVSMLCLIYADKQCVDFEHQAQYLGPKEPQLKFHCSPENDSD